MSDTYQATYEEYEKLFGDPPVGPMEVGGLEEYEQILKAAIDAGKPLPDPYFPDLPAGEAMY